MRESQRKLAVDSDDGRMPRRRTRAALLIGASWLCASAGFAGDAPPAEPIVAAETTAAAETATPDPNATTNPEPGAGDPATPATAPAAALPSPGQSPVPTSATSPQPAGHLSFEHQIRPLLKVHCLHCHGEAGEKEGGLDLRLKRLLLAGGESGPAIVPGDAASSRLWQRVQSGEMPPGKKKLSSTEVATIEAWINEGAPLARDSEPEDPNAADSPTVDELEFWSFRPITRPNVPTVATSNRVTTPIDAFLLAELERVGLTFSGEADRVTQIRRATLDLWGLPPTPDEIAAFLQDDSAAAYERLLDRLLESPRYAEHWGRHWLDLAGYADSDGYSTEDRIRPFAWKYRDYVIRSIHQDKPFDQFLVEQLAGDELVPQPYRDLSPDQQDLLAATGFLRMVPDGTESGGGVEARHEVVTEAIKVLSSSLLGLTVGCAQCHNHKYDPITQRDYYSLRAILAPAYDVANWRGPSGRTVSLYVSADRVQASVIETEAMALEKRRDAEVESVVAEVLQREIVKVPEELRERLLGMRTANHAAFTEEEKQLANKYINVVYLNAGTIELYDQRSVEIRNSYNSKIAAVRGRKPVEVLLPILNEPANQTPPVTHVFHRGNIDQPRDAVPPAQLSVLARYFPEGIPEDDPALATTGRRLAFARQLTSGRHPLVPRVLVNQFWRHHFGRGLVSTPADFGLLGDRPTHPELLDWLAQSFIDSGWKLKPLHRLIMLSSAYRQQSQRSAAAEQIDPDNKLLSRMSVRRLTAESVRDSALAVAGLLNLQEFGRPVPVAIDQFGQVIPGVEFIDGNGIAQPNRELGGEEFRRSIYLQVRRTRPLSVLEAFDLPMMEPNCDIRSVSTVPPQSLLLMNSDFAIQAAAAFARRLNKDVSGSSPVNEQTVIDRAFQLAYGRSPAAAEQTRLAAFLKQQRELAAARTPQPVLPAEQNTGEQPISALPAIDRSEQIRQSALAQLCQLLICSNEFLYVD